MCGDGANDLMAIRVANVGIGLSNTDASYSASFTIKDILEVDDIIRESKATCCNIIEVIRYYELISIVKIICSLLMMTDTSFWNESQLLYYNFACTVIFPLFQVFGRPSTTPTPYIPQANFMGFYNHLRFWVSTILVSAGFIAGFFYIKTTDDYIPNPEPYASLDR